MNVMPTCSWMRLSSICISLRSFRSSAPSGSSSSSTRGSVDQRPRQRDPLLLAAGEHRGRCLSRPGQLHQLERLARPRVALGLADAALLQPVGDVVQHRHVREQRVLLEDGVDVALVRRGADRVDAADQDLALVGLLEAGDHPQRRGLAAARTGPSSERNSPLLHLEGRRRSTAVRSPNRLVTARNSTSYADPCPSELTPAASPGGARPSRPADRRATATNPDHGDGQPCAAT